MAQSVDEILAGAKQTLADANSKFPSAPPAPSKPSYTQAHEARKPNIGTELATKKTMVDKAKSAIQ